MVEQLLLWSDSDADASPPIVAPANEPPPALQLQPMDDSPPQLITSGLIAVTLNESARRVRGVLATRPDIKPAAFAGRTRLYTSAAVARVRHELNAIDAKRCRREEMQ
ncbi:hypothetical protein [Novipirellula caenicola]|uniref:hypothetical protein n=1 Tax=Novipirellula caenicola TaxID=1536901 RepID=UPI0031EC6D71